MAATTLNSVSLVSSVTFDVSCAAADVASSRHAASVPAPRRLLRQRSVARFGMHNKQFKLSSNKPPGGKVAGIAKRKFTGWTMAGSNRSAGRRFCLRENQQPSRKPAYKESFSQVCASEYASSFGGTAHQEPPIFHLRSGHSPKQPGRLNNSSPAR